jgi:hypothetical protein
MYTTTPLLLDLGEDYLLGSQAHLEEKAATTLDERGWSTEGILNAATCYRARNMLKSFREEVLAIAMGHGQDTSVDVLL